MTGGTACEIMLRVINEKRSCFDVADLESPDFSEETRFSGWGWYVSSDVQPVWGELSQEAKLAAVICALERRERDDWSL